MPPQAAGDSVEDFFCPSRVNTKPKIGPRSQETISPKVSASAPPSIVHTPEPILERVTRAEGEAAVTVEEAEVVKAEAEEAARGSDYLDDDLNLSDDSEEEYVEEGVKAEESGGETGEVARDISAKKTGDREGVRKAMPDSLDTDEEDVTGADTAASSGNFATLGESSTPGIEGKNSEKVAVSAPRSQVQAPVPPLEAPVPPVEAPPAAKRRRIAPNFLVDLMQVLDHYTHCSPPYLVQGYEERVEEDRKLLALEKARLSRERSVFAWLVPDPSSLINNPEGWACN